MLHSIVENSLKNIKGSDRFKLVHEAIKRARSAPINIKNKPAIWALKTISENHSEEVPAPTIDESSNS